MSARPVEIGQVVAMLADRIEALVRELLPAGVKEGSEWRVGSVAGEPGRSMAVHLTGPRRGVWCDFGGRPEDRGDALDLVACVLFAGDKKRAFAWSRAWLGIDRVDPRSFNVTPRQVEQRKREVEHEEKRRRESALRIFIGAEERLAGTPAAGYLRGRGIDFDRLGRQPRSLRFARELVDPDGVVWPAMVAAITDPTGRVSAVHRTFLEVQPSGAVAKAPIENAKLTLGRYSGGCIRIWRGKSGKPFKEAVHGETVMIGEGIEDTLSAVMVMPELRAIAAVSLSNMANLWLPDAIGDVLLLAQNDPALDSRGERHPAQIALERAIKHFQAIGKRVRVFRPPSGARDLNELLTKTSRTEGAA